MDKEPEARRQREAFIAEALLADEQILLERVGHDAEEVHSHIRARIAGENPQRPDPKP